jgi:hypothetical protein
MTRSTTVAALSAATLLLSGLATAPPAPASSKYPESYWYTCGHLGVPCADRERSKKRSAKARKARARRAARHRVSNPQA